MVSSLVATTAPTLPEEPSTDTPAAPAPFSLASRAMLVFYTKSGWSGAKRDAGVAAEVARQKRANAQWGHYTKSLIAKEALAKVRTRTQSAYEDHLGRTMPWLSNGTRLLPAKGIAEYEQSQAEHTRLVAEAKEELARNFAGYVEQARREQEGLGQMFNEEDYKDAATGQQVSDRFQIGYRLAALPPDVTDFRVDVGDATLARIKAQAAEDARQVLRDGMVGVVERIIETVGHMADGLADFKRTVTKDPATGKVKQTTEGIFRDSLVGNVADLAELLPSLNLVDDPRLAALAERIKRDLTAYEPEALKADDVTRAQVASKADAIRAEAKKIARQMADFV